MNYPEYVSAVIDRLEKGGYEAYIVGGSVRDMLLGATPDDFDITTSATPDQMLRVFADMRTVPTGLKHGTVTVISDSRAVEVTTYRLDGEYSDRRRPDSVIFTDRIAEDLARRDFTVNAMAYSKKRGLVDLYGGREDLEGHIIRAVGDPEKRFSEDALRIMRAFRFAAKLGFDIDDRTLAAASRLRAGLFDIAAERKSTELLKLLCAPFAAQALEKMRKAEIFFCIFGDYAPSPELCQCLCKAPATDHVRLGMILSEAPAQARDQILSSMRLSAKQVSRARRIAGALDKRYEGGAVEARRFICRFEDFSRDILAAARSLDLLDEDFEREVLRSLDKNECTGICQLAIGGDDLVRVGFRGRNIGDALEYLLSAVLDDPALNTEQSLTVLAAEYLAVISKNEE